MQIKLLVPTSSRLASLSQGKSNIISFVIQSNATSKIRRHEGPESDVVTARVITSDFGLSISKLRRSQTSFSWRNYVNLAHLYSIYLGISPHSCLSFPDTA